MIYDYPTLIVDNFFKQPLDVRKLALSLDFHPCERGSFSGIRTISLHTTHLNFFRKVCDKILDCYSLQYTNYEATMHFHLTGKEFGSSGWVHKDSIDADGSVLAAIVYLNLDQENSSGTSLYRLNNLNHCDDDNIKAMKQSFITSKDNAELKENHNKNFIETVRVSGLFNRLVAYDAKQRHAGIGYFGEGKDDSRLTMVIFFHKIYTEGGVTVFKRVDSRSDL